MKKTPDAEAVTAAAGETEEKPGTEAKAKAKAETKAETKAKADTDAEAAAGTDRQENGAEPEAPPGTDTAEKPPAKRSAGRRTRTRKPSADPSETPPPADTEQEKKIAEPDGAAGGISARADAVPSDAVSFLTGNKNINSDFEQAETASGNPSAEETVSKETAPEEPDSGAVIADPAAYDAVCVQLFRLIDRGDVRAIKLYFDLFDRVKKQSEARRAAEASRSAEGRTDDILRGAETLEELASIRCAVFGRDALEADRRDSLEAMKNKWSILCEDDESFVPGTAADAEDGQDADHGSDREEEELF